MREKRELLKSNSNQTVTVRLFPCPISKPMACLFKNIISISTKNDDYALSPDTKRKIHGIDT